MIWPIRSSTKTKGWKEEVITSLFAYGLEFCHVGIQNLVPRLNENLNKVGDFVGKLLKVCVKSLFY